MMFDIKAMFEPLFRNSFKQIGRVAPDVKPNNKVAITIIIKLFEKYIGSDINKQIFMIFIAYSFYGN